MLLMDNILAPTNDACRILQEVLYQCRFLASYERYCAHLAHILNEIVTNETVA
jgi:hypothetical protein